MLVFIILLVMLLGRGALGRLVGAKRYDPGRAAVMALAGAPVLAGAAFIPLMALFFFGEWAGYRWLGLLMRVLLTPLPFLVAGLWSGWRFGRWGWAWGPVALMLPLLLLGGAEILIPESPLEALTGLAFLAISALGGWLGARWFQRSLRKQLPVPQPAPASSGSR